MAKSITGRGPKIETEIALTAGIEGFWLKIRTNAPLHYKIEYFVIGASGFQRRGEIEGTLRTDALDRFIEVGFDVIVVGIVRESLSFGEEQIARDRLS